MSTEYIVSLITIVITLILGIIAKKNKHISNYLIPVQDLLVGIIVAVIEWIITKDFNTAIALSGLVAGGTYDIINNLRKLLNSKGE